MKTIKIEMFKVKVSANKIRVWLINRNNCGTSVSYCDISMMSNKAQLMVSPGYS